MRARSREAEETIRRMAYFDELTGLPNRLQLQERLAAALAEARTANRPLSVLYLEVGSYREITEALGYRESDSLLQEIAARLVEAVGGCELVARVGDDAFVTLLARGDAVVPRRVEWVEAAGRWLGLGLARESVCFTSVPLSHAAAMAATRTIPALRVVAFLMIILPVVCLQGSIRYPANPADGQSRADAKECHDPRSFELESAPHERRPAPGAGTFRRERPGHHLRPYAQLGGGQLDRRGGSLRRARVGQEPASQHC
jgi:GGDEF domain-containing protein